MDRILRFGLITAVAAIALLVPTRAASDNPPPVIEVTVSLTDLPPAVVNVTTPEQHVVLPIQPAPVVNVDVTIPEMPTPVVNVEQSQPQVVYQDREVERIVTVETPACLDYTDLPHFDLANALTAAFPGEPWSLSGSHYPGLVWHGEGPQPDMTQIIGGWLAHLSETC